jgi:hypothetical protein
MRAHLNSSKVGDLADGVVVFLDGGVPIGDLLEQVAAAERLELVVAPEDGHVAEGRGQDLVVRVEEGVDAVHLPVPQQEDHQEDVLGGVQVEVGLQDGLPDGRGLSHFDRDEALPWHAHAHGVGRDVPPGVHASHFRHGRRVVRKGGLAQRLLLLLVQRVARRRSGGLHHGSMRRRTYARGSSRR